MNKKTLAILAGGLVVISTLGAVICSTITIYMCNKLTGRVSLVQKDVTAMSNAYTKEEETQTDPQYVTIANQYEILDTSAISDAYLSNDSSNLSEEDKETLQLASDVLNKITNDNMSLYEKELAIHDWMVTNITYDNNNLASIPSPGGCSYKPYGVLKYKKSVCVGYATTFKLFMNMLGADCMVIHDTELSHSWDIVKLDDNQWYLVDVTFDHQDDSNGSKTILYSNFNQTSDAFSSSHTWDESLYPTATGTLYNYAALNSTEVKDVTKLPKLIKKAITDKKQALYYKLPKDVDNDYMMALIDGIQQRLDDDASFDVSYSFTSDQRPVLSITIAYYNQENNENADYADLINELNNLFGQPVEY